MDITSLLEAVLLLSEHSFEVELGGKGSGEGRYEQERGNAKDPS